MGADRRTLVLLALCTATVLLVPLERYLLGGVFWVSALLLLLRDPDAAVRRRLGAVLACVALLAAAPIDTDRSTGHMVALGLPFLAAVLGPALLLRRRPQLRIFAIGVGVMLFSLMGLLVGLLSDLIYTWIDPRIDFESREV